ncbi:ATP-binding protein [Thiomicrorhabdus sp. zzn3]|uniref:ATP-binding protein n=1 Tax=Thiomicrorhabdus sp. zzn3 TaxID=3039775 RepID=UPI002436E04D|nr:ATP-binding protein [Thiomicrorhabdus sp. zzn3]MDG6778969.1 ATP-binding protein [Thiomicrorhabdus sp. zzn3]
MELTLSKRIKKWLRVFTPGFAFGLLLIALMIYLGGQYLQASFQSRVAETAEVTARGVSSLIVERLQNYQTVMRSVANHHEDRIYELSSGGGYPYDLSQISSEIYTLFDEVRQFAVVDEVGKVVVGSMTGVQGDALPNQCQQQIERVMQSTFEPVETQLHSGPNGKHLDVVIKISRGREVAGLFASFSLEPLQKLLKRFETPELNLLIVNASQVNQVLLTSNSLEKERETIPQALLQETLSIAPVEGTRWQLIALPANALFTRYAHKVSFFSWLLFAATTVVLMIFLHFLRVANEARFQAEQKASYSALFNAGPTVLLEKNVQSGMAIDYVSPNVLQLLGFTDAELADERSFYDLIHPQDLPEFKRALQEANERRQTSFEMEYRLMRSDWNYIWVYSLVHLSRDPLGRLHKVQGYITSINAQKLAEQQATTLIENAPDAMIVTDLNGHILRVNKMAEQLFDYSKEALLQQPMGRLIPSYDEALKLIQREETATHRECQGVSRLQKTLMLGISLSRLQTSEGMMIASVIRDVSLQKAAEAQMRVAKEKAEALAQARSHFMAMVSHEIRTPMNGVLGMAELLSETPLDTQQQSYLQAIRDSGRSLISILNDVLDFSKLDKGGIRLRIEAFDLYDLLYGSIQLLQPEAKINGVSLSLDYDAACPHRFKGDALRIRQVVLNLLGNAIKFSPQGEVNLALRVLEENDRGLVVCLSVADTGIGIDPMHVDRLFEPFTQVDSSTSRHFGGTGLGLAISKQLVDLMNGQIEVTSEVGKGSLFKVILTLPKAEEDTKDIQKASAETRVVKTAPEMAVPQKLETLSTEKEFSEVAVDNQQPRVLLVEDDRVNQQIAEAFIEKMGLAVDIAHNGVEALEFWRLHRHQYALILMDCQMPKMDGFETSRIIREEEAQMDGHVPSIIIAFTANAFEEDEARCLQAGMNDFLIKPLYADQFEATIYKWLPELQTDLTTID